MRNLSKISFSSIDWIIWNKLLSYIWNVSYIELRIWNQVSHDHRSYERNLSNCVEKPEKVRTSTGFEPVTSRYRCDALTNWVMKPLTLGAGHLWVLMSPWRMDVKLYMKCFIYWTADSTASLRNCLSYVHNCDDHGLLDFKSAVQAIFANQFCSKKIHIRHFVLFLAHYATLASDSFTGAMLAGKPPPPLSSRPEFDPPLKSERYRRKKGIKFTRVEKNLKPLV